MKHIKAIKKIQLIILLLFVSIIKIQAQSVILSPDPVFMGKIPTGSSATQEVAIFNSSNQNVNITDISLDGQSAARFEITDNPNMYSLDPFSELLLDIVYTPTATGQDIAELQIKTETKGVASLELIGYGTKIIDGLTTFERIYGKTEIELEGSSVKQTLDGGFIIVGPAVDYSKLDVKTDYYALKTDKFGEEEWLKTWGGYLTDVMVDVLALDDGNFILLGETQNIPGKLRDVTLFKMNSNGEIIWEKNYGSSLDEVPHRIIPASDGGYVVCGRTEETQDAKALVLKTDSEGNLQWMKKYGSHLGENAYDITEAHDGGYIFVGSHQDRDDINVYLVKIDESGNEEWSRIFHSDEPAEGYSISKTRDGGYIIAGFSTTQDRAREGYLLKVDVGGQKQWSNEFGSPHSDYFSSVIQTPDDGYLAVGAINHVFTVEHLYDNVYVVKTDSEGNLIWEKEFGGDIHDYASSMIMTEGGSYAIVGTTESFAPLSRLYFLQINREGIITRIDENKDIEVPSRFLLAQNYPNPFNPTTNIEFSLPQRQEVVLKVYDLLGREVTTLVNTELGAGVHKVSFDASNLPSGVYFYRMQAGEFSDTKKMVFIL